MQFLDLIKQGLVECCEVKSMTGNGWHLPSIGSQLAFWLSAVELRSDFVTLERPLSCESLVVVDDATDEETSAGPNGLVTEDCDACSVATSCEETFGGEAFCFPT